MNNNNKNEIYIFFKSIQTICLHLDIILKTYVEKQTTNVEANTTHRMDS